MANEQVREVRRVAGALAAGLGRLGLHQVEDPRCPGQVRQPLVRLLVTVLLGLASGQRSLREVERVTDKLAFPVRRRLKIFSKIPDTTLRSLLVRLEPDALRQLLHRQVRSAHRSKQLEPVGLPFGVVAIDGKHTPTRLPSGEYAQRQGDTWLLRTMSCSLVSAAAPVVLDAVPVPAETNEMGIFAKVLDALYAVYGSLLLFRLLTADAGMTSLHNANLVRAKGWDYVFALKETQAGLLDEAHRLVGPNVCSAPDAETVDVLDNSTEDVRQVWLTSDAAGYHGWGHLKTILRVRRIVRRDDGVVRSCEDRYFASSLAADALTPRQWLLTVRDHWRVENGVHGVLDCFYEEDKHPWIYATAGQLAVQLLRRVVINLMSLHRNVSRRGERKGDIPWRELIHTAHVVLIGATEEIMDGLRWPLVPALRARGRPS